MTAKRKKTAGQYEKYPVYALRVTHCLRARFEALPPSERRRVAFGVRRALETQLDVLERQDRKQASLRAVTRTLLAA